ncbi:hypothetical protein ACFE04_005352 [Oxalis oulophora]
MGGCLSGDLKGGKEAVGGNGDNAATTTTGGGGGGGAPNDAVDNFYRCQGLQALFTQIELSLSASNLSDQDIISKSDPMAVVYEKNRDGILREIGRTEVILNSLNPSWIGKILIAYKFETTLNLQNQDFLGEATCFLSEIVTKQNQTQTLTLKGRNRREGRNLGTLTIHAEETIASKSVAEITFRCSNLENKDLFSLSTEVINNNLNPVWRPLTLKMQQFGSKDNPLVIECFDFDSNGNHGLIGKLQKSVAELERLHGERSGANFILPRHGREKILKGQLFVDRFVEKKQYSFLDYISSGFELNFMVAIDFTASNGSPRSPNSLHYIDPSGRWNSYQQAIMEVGEVIQFYDSDRHFPAWGFGGKAFNMPTSHCFNLNGNTNDVEVYGVEGIMQAYDSALHNVALDGPTLFSQVINTASQIAGHSLTHDSNKYFALLIITDGVLTDLQDTKDALVKASDLPLSILIVGVGNADFTQMETLDADNGRRLVSSSGRVATRDIVQFVPMREVQSGRLSAIEALLEELPGQFLTYMRSKDRKPLGVH